MSGDPQLYTDYSRSSKNSRPVGPRFSKWLSPDVLKGAIKFRPPRGHYIADFGVCVYAMEPMAFILQQPIAALVAGCLTVVAG